MSVPSPAFSRERSGDTLIVVPHGNLFRYREDELRGGYNDIYRLLDDTRNQNFLVDCIDVDHFGSTFIAILCQLCQKVRRAGGQAALCGLPEDMLKSLMLLERNNKTAFYWDTYGNRAEALAALASDSPSAGE